MASGRLGTADLAATTNTTVYTVPTNTKTFCSVNACNRNATPVNIRLALSDTGTPGLDEYIEYDLQVDEAAERTGIVLQADKRVVAYSDTANVSVVVYGEEVSTI